MEVFVRIDDLLLSFFTKVSHWWQRLTGLTNYWLAKCSLMVTGTSVLVIILNYWYPLLSYKTDLGRLVMGGFLIISCCMCIMIMDEDDAQAQNGDMRAISANATTGGEIFFRISFLFLILIGMIQLPIHLLKTKSVVLELMSECLNPSMLCFFYLIAVHPLPPAKSKVRERIEGLQPEPQQACVKIPVK